MHFCATAPINSLDLKFCFLVTQKNLFFLGIFVFELVTGMATAMKGRADSA